jgi:Type I restriction-modification system methyltransferase subunit
VTNHAHIAVVPTGGHASPRKGHVLSTVVEEIALPARRAVAALQKLSIPSAVREVIGLSQNAKTPSFTEDEAWHLVSICLIAVKNSAGLDKGGVATVIEWFFGIGRIELGAALAPLAEFFERISADKRVGDLLPYIIDAHGPGSRLSVRKAPETSHSRAKKKSAGVFYTPADVAEYMANTVLAALIGREPPTILDPAVGTGVFLRAALSHLRGLYHHVSLFDLASKHLYGADIDPFALNGAAFVLLHDVMNHLPADVTPARAWAILRSNLVRVDSLYLDKEDGSLGLHFPALADGADVVIGNPPYAPIGDRDDLGQLAKRFKTVAAHQRSTADLYPIFVEQMVRLARSDGSGAMVVPLSLACNSGKQFRACRAVIEETPGVWKLAFFDREPHALFGEDVKTRNTIVFRNNSPEGEHQLMTGPLRRWRGIDRHILLSSIDFTDISGFSIASGVPKIRGVSQAQALQAMSGKTTLGSLLINSGKTELSQLPNAHRTEVLVGPTAYNFLNIARSTVLPLSPGEELSQNALHRLMALDDEMACVVYALLSTDFAFWWWYVHGDGFHVNLSHLLNLPVGNLGEATVSELADVGRNLWAEARRTPIKSSNKARVTFSFPTRSFGHLRQKALEIQLRSLTLGAEFAASLDVFVSAVVDARVFPRHNQ